MTIGGRHRRQIVQLRIRFTVPGKKRNTRTALFGKRAKLLNTIGPVTTAPQQTHDDQFGGRHGVGKIAVHRKRMVETEVIGDPNGRPMRRCKGGINSCGQQAYLGVRRCQNDDVAGWLPEIDSFVRIVE